MGSALPTYQPHTIPFSQHRQLVHQQYIPPHQPQGLVYPVQQLPYPGQAPSSTAAYIMPYPPAFQTPYGQHQQHHQHAHYQQAPPGYQHYLPSLPLHQGSAMLEQTSLHRQPHLVQHPYTAALGSRRTTENFGIPQQAGIHYHDRQAPTPSGAQSSGREGKKRGSKTIYDVSQTIVDGSSLMKPAKARLQTPGRKLRWIFAPGST
jgi:hypothetical protein